MRYVETERSMLRIAAKRFIRIGPTSGLYHGILTMRSFVRNGSSSVRVVMADAILHWRRSERVIGSTAVGGTHAH